MERNKREKEKWEKERGEEEGERRGERWRRERKRGGLRNPWRVQICSHVSGDVDMLQKQTSYTVSSKNHKILYSIIVVI